MGVTEWLVCALLGFGLTARPMASRAPSSDEWLALFDNFTTAWSKGNGGPSNYPALREMFAVPCDCLRIVYKPPFWGNNEIEGCRCPGFRDKDMDKLIDMAPPSDETPIELAAQAFTYQDPSIYSYMWHVWKAQSLPDGRIDAKIIFTSFNADGKITGVYQHKLMKLLSGPRAPEAIPPALPELDTSARNDHKIAVEACERMRESWKGSGSQSFENFSNAFATDAELTIYDDTTGTHHRYNYFTLADAWSEFFSTSRFQRLDDHTTGAKCDDYIPCQGRSHGGPSDLRGCAAFAMTYPSKYVEELRGLNYTDLHCHMPAVDKSNPTEPKLRRMHCAYFQL